MTAEGSVLMQRKINTYDEFWQYYLEEHSHFATKLLHTAGTIIGAIVAIDAVYRQAPWRLVLALIIGYGFAWISHFFIEKNKPATFKHPLWSLISDFRMAALVMTGRLR